MVEHLAWKHVQLNELMSCCLTSMCSLRNQHIASLDGVSSDTDHSYDSVKERAHEWKTE